MVDEEDPPTVRQTTHNFHCVVMDFNRLAVVICAGNTPLRSAQGKVARYRRVVHNDVHVRLQSDVASHRLANPSRAARYCVSPVDLVQSDHTRIGIVHRGRSLDVMRVKSSREPEVDEFW